MKLFDLPLNCRGTGLVFFKIAVETFRLYQISGFSIINLVMIGTIIQLVKEIDHTSCPSWVLVYLIHPDGFIFSITRMKIINTHCTIAKIVIKKLLLAMLAGYEKKK